MTKIIVLGEHCNYDLTLGNLLTRYGIPCKIYRQSLNRLDVESNLGNLNPENFLTGPRSLLLKNIHTKDTVISCTHALYGALGLKQLASLLTLKKISLINVATGSDITELSTKNSLPGYVYRYLLRHSKLNIIPPYPAAIHAMQRLKLKNMKIFRYPYSIKNKDPNTAPHKEKMLTLLHASNIDFGITDYHSSRNSTKGNDRFFKAIIRAIKHGIKLHCVVLDRGPDKEIAKNFIHNENMSAFFSWQPECKMNELAPVLKMADCVIDQFDVGGFGSIAMEAMAQAKPVMIFIDKNCWPLVYAQAPPIINCCTEDEIFNAILAFSHREKLQALGIEAEAWVRKNHDVQIADFSSLILNICLASQLKWPRHTLEQRTV